MSDHKKFTWRYIAKEVAIGPFDREIYCEAWKGLCRFMYACLVFVVRVLMLATYPVSVPFLWGFFRVMGPVNQRRRKARAEKLMAEYRKRMKEAE